MNKCTGENIIFYCNEWLSCAKNDKRVEVELSKPGCGQSLEDSEGGASWDIPSIKPTWDCPQPLIAASIRNLAASKQPTSSEVGYKVTFWTSNIWFGGTGDSIRFEITGDRRSSGILKTNKDCTIPQIQRGMATVFAYPQVPYLGHLSVLHVSMDDSCNMSRWHLRIVEVEHICTGTIWRFQCHAWIDKCSGWSRVIYTDSHAYATRASLCGKHSEVDL